jgi:hypothetical protein
LLSVYIYRPTDVLYVENFDLSPVNTVGSRTLIRVSFFNSIIVVVIGVSNLSSLLSLITEAVSSALSLPLIDIMIIFMFIRSLPILSNENI